MIAANPQADGTSETRRTTPLRVAIVGAGAVGLGFGSALHVSGAEVHFMVREGMAGAHPLRSGYRRRGLFGEVDVPATAMHLHDDMAALRDVDPDYVLVCTKTTATPQLAPALGHALEATPRPCPLVICHNGWGSSEQFARHVQRSRVFNARVITGFRCPAADCVEITVHAAPVHMGSLFGAATEPLAPLCRAIDEGGLPCAATNDIAADLLAKLLYNGLLNPLGALVGVPYGELAKRTATRATMESIAQEIFAVMDAADLHTHWPHADAYLETFYGELLPPTAGHESSMLQDLRAGRATEVDALCGAIVELGRAHQVPTPVNAALATLIAAAEAKA